MFCPKCGTNLPVETKFCPVCGTAVFENDRRQPPVSASVSWDHTAEFDSKDIADHKLYCMLIYLTGLFGILIALLKAKDSDYLNFHVCQGLKFTIVSALVTLATAVLCWTIIVPFLGGILLFALSIIKIICFVQVCNGKAVEAAIIRSLGFLR